jgi:spore coat polysaccharide biosynthesis predicted glycosyltransferase SpsG
MLKPMIEKVVSGYPTLSLIVYDHEEEGAKYFLNLHNIKSVPAFFFIKEGEISDIHFGAITVPVLKTKIEKLINEG